MAELSSTSLAPDHWPRRASVPVRCAWVLAGLALGVLLFHVSAHAGPDTGDHGATCPLCVSGASAPTLPEAPHAAPAPSYEAPPRVRAESDRNPPATWMHSPRTSRGPPALNR